MSIIGIDPGLVNTGLAVITNGVLENTRLLHLPNNAKLPLGVAVGNVVDGVHEWLSSIGHLPRITDVIIEHVQWMGRRQGMIPLAHLAGALAGFSFIFQDTRVWLVPPGAKERQSAALKTMSLSEHEKDAILLAKLAYPTCDVLWAAGYAPLGATPRVAAKTRTRRRRRVKHRAKRK